MTSPKLVQVVFRFLLLVLLASGFQPLAAFAATLDVLDRQRQVQPGPRALPPLRVTEEAGEPAYDQGLRFALASLRVEGATVFSEQELLAPYASLYGTEVSFTSINTIAAELTKKYRDKGYLLSRVILPAQELDPLKADVLLVAVEGYISAVEYEGQKQLVQRFRSYFSGVEQALLGKRPLRHKDFEREMLLLQDLAGVKVSSRFKEGAERGASVLVLTVEPDVLDATMSWDNNGTDSAGPHMFNISLGVSTLPVIGARTTVSWVQAANSQEYHSIQVAQSYRFSGGLLLQGSYAYSASPQPDTSFAREFGYETWSHTVDLGLTYPLIRSRDMNLSTGLSFISRDSYGDLLSQRYTTDRLRSVKAQINFDIADEWGGVTQAIPSFTHGLNIFNASDKNWDSSNTLAPAEYAKFEFYLSRNQQLFSQFSLFTAMNAQFTDVPLSSYNQFMLGGAQFGRGFEPGIIQNDNGFTFTVEPRWTHWLTETTAVQPYIFYDWGKVWSARSLENAPDHEDLSSIGAGVRLWGHVGKDYLPDFNVGFFVAKGLRTIRDEGDDARCGVQFTLMF